MDEALTQYMKTLEEQVKAQALLITKLQSELITYKQRAIKFETEVTALKQKEEE
jgi:hypothetical protein